MKNTHGNNDPPKKTNSPKKPTPDTHTTSTCSTSSSSRDMPFTRSAARLAAKSASTQQQHQEKKPAGGGTAAARDLRNTKPQPQPHHTSTSTSSTTSRDGRNASGNSVASRLPGNGQSQNGTQSQSRRQRSQNSAPVDVDVDVDANGDADCDIVAPGDSEERIESFVSLTNCDRDAARQFLMVHGWDLEWSVNEFLGEGSKPEQAEVRAPIKSIVDQIQPRSPRVNKQGHISMPTSGFSKNVPLPVFDSFKKAGSGSKLPAIKQRSSEGLCDPKKLNVLEEIFRPPVDLLNPGPFETVMCLATQKEKWMLVSLIDPLKDFPSNVLNRDGWKNPEIHQLVKNNFILWQMDISSPDTQSYKTCYQPEGPVPHLAILDWLTRECKAKHNGPITCDELRTFLKNFLRDHGDDNNFECDNIATSNQHTATSIQRTSSGTTLGTSKSNTGTTLGTSKSNTTCSAEEIVELQDSEEEKEDSDEVMAKREPLTNEHHYRSPPNKKPRCDAATDKQVTSSKAFKMLGKSDPSKECTVPKPEHVSTSPSAPQQPPPSLTPAVDPLQGVPEKDICEIKIRHNESTTVVRLLVNSTLSDLRKQVEAKCNPPANFKLFTIFPRKELTDPSETLTNLGLAPRSVLLLF
ncbi:hypothetical protein Pelo_11570 [Pelomyxa schiedti]|nr:hypothetical protein Pelo_11570 [Pelomyxa schiedti]